MVNGIFLRVHENKKLKSLHETHITLITEQQSL